MLQNERLPIPLLGTMVVRVQTSRMKIIYVYVIRIVKSVALGALVTARYILVSLLIVSDGKPASVTASWPGQRQHERVFANDIN